jgi:inactivated superfamily I helicase
MQTNLCPGRLNLVSEVVVADRNENLIGNNPVTDAFLSG